MQTSIYFKYWGQVLLAFILMLPSCNKEDDLTEHDFVKGRVVDKVDGSPVEDVFVSLQSYTSHFAAGAGLQDLTTEAIASTGDNGEFEFYPVDWDEDRSYRVSTQKEHYYEDAYPVSTFHPEVTCRITPYAWVRFHLVDIPPNDTMSGFSISAHMNLEVSDPPNDTSVIDHFYYSDDGVKEVGISLHFSGSREDEYRREQLNLVRLDTVYHRVEY